MKWNADFFKKKHKMNTITGKIALLNTGAGIANLLVVVYDVDPETKPEEVIAELASTSAKAKTRTKSGNDLGFVGDRIGSVLTGQDGSFTLSYEDEAFQIHDSREVRPDLFLMVFAPEQTNKSLTESLLFYSPEIRYNAGRTETYYIQITGEQLKSANLPTTIQSPQNDLKTVVDSIQHNRKYAKEVSSNLVQAERKKQKDLDGIIKNKVLPSFFKMEQAPKNLPTTKADVEKHIESNLNKLNKDVFANKKAKAVRLFVQVPDSEVPKMKKASSDEFGKLLQPYLSDFEKLEVEGSVFRKQFGQTASITDVTLPGNDVEPSKKQKSSNTSSVTSLESDDSQEMSSGDIPKFVHKLIEHIISPEDLLLNNNIDNINKVKQRPNNTTVLKNVDELTLTGGPAEAPAFYDFHSLQIAFPDVWQELVDNDVIVITEKLLAVLNEMGVDIGELSDTDDILAMLRKHVDAVSIASTQIKDFAAPQGRPIFNPNQNEQTSPQSRHYAEADRVPYSRTDTAPTLSPGKALIKDLEELLAAPNKFTVFKEGIINYGVMVSYRQKWTPQNYQVGDLVRSIPLSPKEVRKVTTKRVIKTDRTVKEMENNLQSRQNESTETGRTESEIVDKAQKNTSFGASASYTAPFGLTASADFKSDSSKSSDATKKNFREAVVKAAQEFKDERKLEVETKETYENEFSESTEISNPNDELTVTYLFYELQRRFEVSEHLYKITPVVLVPMPVPNPDKKEITQLILKYCWVINRVLLDDRFRPALDYIMSGMIGEEAAIDQMQVALSTIKSNIDMLGSEIMRARSSVTKAQDLLTEETDEQVAGESKKKITEREKYKIENKKTVVDQALELERTLSEKLATAETTYTRTNEALVKMKTQYRTRLFEIDILRLHIKENIFYYMQAIWDYTHKDQLFMTLYDDIVPIILAKEKAYSFIGEAAEVPPSITPLSGHTIVEAEVRFEFEAEPIDQEQSLIQIADLDRPMGYKGNYMIFPMRQSNAITEYMMTPYIDEELGLRDPDGPGHWTPDEFVKYVNHLRATKTKPEFDALEAGLTIQFGRILSASRRLTEEIIVPTDSLFIEALPGKQPLLEDFKLMHRAMDVQKVQAEVRALELENLRYAARLLNDEREDPRIEKKIVVEGNGLGHSLNIGDPN